MRILITAVLALVIFLNTGLVYAAGNTDVYSGVDCSQDKQSQSAICSRTSGDPDPIAGSGGILAKATNIVAIVAGAAAIIMILVSSIRFVSSGGDSAKVKRAQDTIIYSLIGIAVIILARSLIIYVIGKLQ